MRDSARLLNVPEKTLSRWAREGRLPASRVNEQYRFNRVELMEWAAMQRINFSTEICEEVEKPVGFSGVTEALKVGGIHFGVNGDDKVSALRAVVALMPLPEEVDRQFLLQVLLARESLGSTGLGDGIAVPHVRNPIVMRIPQPVITLCFLRKAIDFAAVDGKPVHTLFAIVSPTMRAHIHLLSRLAFALRQPRFAAVIARQATSEEILAESEAVNRGMPLPQGDRPDQAE